ncbi:hypothetical protein JG688_00015658, partial [Phytophthora aleatoria]
MQSRRPWLLRQHCSSVSYHSGYIRSMVKLQYLGRQHSGSLSVGYGPLQRWRHGTGIHRRHRSRA